MCGSCVKKNTSHNTQPSVATDLRKINYIHTPKSYKSGRGHIRVCYIIGDHGGKIINF